MTVVDVKRRDLFKAAGGGVVIFFGCGLLADAPAQRRPLYPADFHAYLAVGENGRVTVFTGKIEMGQGVMTSQAQMAAEELCVPLSAIDMVMGDTDRCPWDEGTYGSLTTRMFGPYLRAAAAKARTVMLDLAAKHLGAAVTDLAVKDGIVSVAGAPARQVSYAALSKEARIAQSVDEKAVLHDAAQFTVMGRSAKRLDGVEKVTGAARYAADIRLPGMLYARILRPPQHGAKLAHVDVSAAKRLAGVSVVQEGDLVAVLHEDPEAANRALGKVFADWQRPPATLNPDTIFDHIMHAATDVHVVEEKGRVAPSAKAYEATYRKGYVAHAPIETHAALAEVKAGKATVWASTQTPFPMRDSIAKALGFASKNVRVITPYVGGGFGGKGSGQQGVEAALLARHTGRPVQVAYSRAEEFYFDTFDPAAVVTVKAGLNAQNRIASWDYVVYAAGARGATLLYDVPQVRVRSAGGPSYEGAAAEQGLHPFATGPWRAPGANMNVYASETAIDALAHLAGADPLDFRLAHLSDARLTRVLKTAAEAFRYSPMKGPSGRGIGMAITSDAESVAATFAQVSVDKQSGAVKVERMVCAIDMGVVVNPEGARMQCEGGLTQGLGYTFAEELRFQGGQILDTNFDSYSLPRFSWVPQIEIVLVKNDTLPPKGCGEPAITTVGASIANAVFDATGAHVMRLPMTPERVLAALKMAKA